MSALTWTFDQNLGEIDTYRSGANLKIVLNRPRNGNALTTQMVKQLTKYFHAAADDNRISRIILTAKGKFFCTGMDLSKSGTCVGNHDDTTSSEFKKFVKLFATIDKCPKVTIACLNGPCYAGGVGLAFACDIRLSISKASATLSEVKLGLCPAIISTYVVREWGLSFTREAMLSGRTVPISELKALGAVHGLAESAASLEQLLQGYLHNLSRCAPKASAYCKSTIQAAWTHPGAEEQGKTIRQIFEEMMSPGAESSIGVSNFQSKKTTDWDSLQTCQAKL